MLEILRKKAQSPVLQTIVVIIVLVFVFWGVGTNNNNSGGQNVATVNDTPILYPDYQQAYDQAITKLREQFGGNIPKGFLESFDLQTQVLDQLIKSMLLRQGGQETGLLVSKNEVMETVKEMEAFRENGIFSMEQYKAILSGSRMTPATFEESMRRDLLTNKIMDHAGNFAKVVESEVEEIFNYENEEIQLEYVSLKADDFKKKVEISDASLAAFHEENKENYKTAQQVKLKYLAFPFKDIAPSPISDEEAEKFYRQNVDRYSTPEKRGASHILLKTTEGDSDERLTERRQEMESILARARDGEDFGMLAQKYSEGPSAPKGGYLGVFGRGQMVPAFDSAVFALQENEISDVVKTRFGFHIIRLDKIEPATIKPLTEARAEIETTINEGRAKNSSFAKASTAYEEIIRAGSLAKYGETGEATVLETDFFERKSAPTGNGPVNEAAFLNAAFALKKGELSSLVELYQGYAIIYAEDVKEPEIAPYETVKKDVERDYVLQRSETLAKEAATGLLTAAKAAPGLDDWLAEIEKRNLNLQESKFTSRITPDNFQQAQAMQQDLPLSAINKGFGLSAAKPYPDEIETSGRTFYVFKFKEKRKPTAEQFAAQREEFAARLLNKKKEALVTAWLENLRSKAEITKNEQFL